MSSSDNTAVRDRPLVFIKLFPPKGSGQAAEVIHMTKWQGIPYANGPTTYPGARFDTFGANVWTGVPFALPRLQVKTQGFPVDVTDRILSFRYEDEERKADRCDITLWNHDLTQFDNPAWRKGGILEVSWGYPGNMTPARRVVIQKIRGGSELKVEGHGMEMVMHKKKETRVWAGKTLAEIAEEMSAKYKASFAAAKPSTRNEQEAAHNKSVRTAMTDQIAGPLANHPLALRPELKADYEKAIDSETQSRVGDGISAHAKSLRIAIAHQSGETDAQFLHRLAKKYGFVWYVDHEGFHLKRVDEGYKQRPRKTITWFYGKGEWMEFDYENDATSKHRKVKGKGTDTLNKQMFTAEASNESTQREGSAPKTGGNIAMEVLGDSGEILKREIDKLAKVSSTGPQIGGGDGGEIATKLKAAMVGLQGAINAGADKGTSEEESTAPFSGTDPGQAKKHVDGKYSRESSAAHQLSGKLVGDPNFLAKTMLMVEGIGRRLSGRWKVKSVEHSIDSNGYVCDFKCERDGDNGYGLKGEKASGANQNKQKPEDAKNKFGYLVSGESGGITHEPWRSPADDKPKEPTR